MGFIEWIKATYGKRYLRIAAIITFLNGLNGIFSLFDWEKIGLLDFNQYYAEINLIIHVIFIIIVCITSIDYKKFSMKLPLIEINENEKKLRDSLQLISIEDTKAKESEKKDILWQRYKEGVNKTLSQFSTFWLFIWLSWLVLYVLLALQELQIVNASPTLSAIITLSNNFSTLMFIFIFLTLSVSTSKLNLIYWVRWSLLVVFIFIIELIVNGRINNPNFDFWFKLGSGIFASVAMMAVYGRLNSKFINIPLIFVILLYLYAAIQPLYVMFDTSYLSLNSLASSNQSKPIKNSSNNFSRDSTKIAVIIDKPNSINLKDLLPPVKLRAFLVDIDSITYDVCMDTTQIKINENWKKLIDFISNDIHFFYIGYLPSIITFITLLLKIFLYLIISWMLQTGRLLFFVVQEASLNYGSELQLEEFLRLPLFEDTYL